MVCIPPGTSGDWIAYAYINSPLSVYNDNWCNSISAQMHEIGHNINLSHSGEGENEYGDQSGMMGSSFSESDSPVMCFNAPKNWQLGWYNDREKTLSISYAGNIDIYGIAEYANTNNGEVVIVKILFPDANEDWYVSFNHRAGINSGTQEGPNQVLIHKRSQGTDTSISTLMAKLFDGRTYWDSPLPITVAAFNFPTSSPAYATVTFGGIPTASPVTLAPTSELCGSENAALGDLGNPAAVFADADLATLATDCEFRFGLSTGYTGVCDFPNNLNQCLDAEGQHHLVFFEYKCSNIVLNFPNFPICAGASCDINHFIDGFLENIYAVILGLVSSDDFPLEVDPYTCDLDFKLLESTRPTPQPTALTTSPPSAQPTVVPTTFSTLQPTAMTTTAPTSSPSKAPTSAPSMAPTKVSTTAPTISPTETPTKAPTMVPTKTPTISPTISPTMVPTKAPTIAPTETPTKAPTMVPTKAPTKAPTKSPTKSPIETPTKAPTKTPIKTVIKASIQTPTKTPANVSTEIPTTTPTKTTFQSRERTSSKEPSGIITSRSIKSLASSVYILTAGSILTMYIFF